MILSSRLKMLVLVLLSLYTIGLHVLLYDAFAYGGVYIPVFLLKNNNQREIWRLERFLQKRTVKVQDVDCSAVLRGDPVQLRLAHAKEKAGANNHTRKETDGHVQRAARTCATFLKEYGFITDPLTKMERDFPIAFSILAYKDSAQVVNLLRTIYRPQNLYCMHVDRSSSADFRHALRAVSHCLPGVFLASRSVNVVWGRFSVLEAELVCMQDLWKNKTWAYVINLTGQEFPLKTNYELVKILKALNGTNDVAGVIPSKTTEKRWGRAPPVPFRMTLYKGAVHVTLVRAFVDFVLHSRVARDFTKWCQRINIPDEVFFNTLNFNPHIRAPGSYEGPEVKHPNVIQPYLSRYKLWKNEGKDACKSQRFVRDICIFSVLQLPEMTGLKELFANKFHLGYSRLALGCLTEDLFNRTRDQTLGRRDFNASYYENIPKAVQAVNSYFHRRPA